MRAPATQTPDMTLDVSTPPTKESPPRSPTPVPTENPLEGVPPEWSEKLIEWSRIVTPPGGIPILNLKIGYGETVSPSTVKVSDNVRGAEGIKLIYTDVSPDNQQALEIVGTISAHLYKRAGISRENDDASKQARSTFRDGLFDDSADTSAFVFITSTKEYAWSPGPDTGVVEYFVNWDDAVSSEGISFTEWQDPYGAKFRTAIIGEDANGNVLGVIASEKPLNELTEEQIRMMTVYHSVCIILQEDQTNIRYSTILGIIAEDSGLGTPPYIGVYQ